MLIAILCIVLTLTMLALSNETPEATAPNGTYVYLRHLQLATDTDAEDGKYRIVNGYKVPKLKEPHETYHMNVMVSSRVLVPGLRNVQVVRRGIGSKGCIRRYH